MNIETPKTFASEPGGKKIEKKGTFIRSTPYFKFQDIKMNIAISKGEQFQGIMQFFDEIGLKIPENRDPRNFQIPVENMPIVLIPFRAGDIPMIVNDERSSAKAGIAGSDIIWEKSYDLGTDRNEGEILPFNELVTYPPKSTLYAGTTWDYWDYLTERLERDISVRDMDGQTFVTIYPNITRQYLESKKLSNSKIFQISGQDEAPQYVYPFTGILGIKSSGKTIEANKIVILDEFYEVAVKLFTFGTDKLTTRDLQILNDLREMTWLALKKRGMV